MEDFTNPTPHDRVQSQVSPAGQNLGIAALITSIITFVLAVIPCIGLIAIIPGIIAIVLASVGLSHAARNNSPRGVLVAGLIIGIIASLISFSQVFVAGKIAQKADKWPHNFQNLVKDVQDQVMKDLEDANVSIKIESNGDKVEISTSTNKKSRTQTLEELEKQNAPANDTVVKKE
jgi:hypothetical protein